MSGEGIDHGIFLMNCSKIKECTHRVLIAVTEVFNYGDIA